MTKTYLVTPDRLFIVSSIMLKRIFILLSFVLMTPTLSQAQVWQDTETWSPKWEQTYQQWVKQNWVKDFFARSHLQNGQRNPYFGLRADCADVVYSMRAIFAFEHKLPFVIRDPTTSNSTISNRMKRFDRVTDPYQRMVKFLQFVYGVVSTQSLPYDTYPVAINKKSVVAGSLIRVVQKNHHSWAIRDITPIGVPHLIYGNRMGAATSPMFFERISWPNMNWVFEGDYSLASGAGIRNWRPAEYLNKPVETVPGFSTEQFKLPLKSWVKIAKGRLAENTETPEAELRRLYNTSCQGLQERITIVKDGVDHLNRTNGCYDYNTYDVHSTPNRDQRLFDDLMALRQAYRDHKANGDISEVNREFLAQLDKIFPMLDQPAAAEAAKMPKQEIGPGSACLIQYDGEKKIDIAEAKRRLFAGLMSNNPLDDMSMRWGEHRGPSQRAKSCPSWDHWSPEFDRDAGLFNLADAFKVDKKETESEVYEFKTAQGVIKRLMIRPLDSDKGSHMEAVLFELDEENLPVPTEVQIIDPTPEQIQKILEGSEIIGHLKAETVRFKNGSAKFVEWNLNQPTVRTLR